MQNNTNGLNEILTLLNNLPEGSSGNPTQDFFVDVDGIHSIALDGTLTLLDIEDLSDASDNSFMEYCRTNIFQMGGVNAANYPDSANPGRQGARGRFLFGDHGSNTIFISYLYNATQSNNIDSMIVECVGGPGTSNAECTMIADIYTVNAQHYQLQICCKGGNYNTDGWQLVSYGGSSDLKICDLSGYSDGDTLSSTDYTKLQNSDFVIVSGRYGNKNIGRKYGIDDESCLIYSSEVSGEESLVFEDIYNISLDGLVTIDYFEKTIESGGSGSSGLTLFSTWTGETNAGGLVMSQNCNDSKLYLVHLGYQIPDDHGGGYVFGQGIFRASGELGKYSWAKIELQRTDNPSVSTVLETLYVTWCPSLGGPAAIIITGYNTLSDTNIIMCNLYQLD